MHCYVCFVLLGFYLRVILCMCLLSFEFSVSACSKAVQRLYPQSLKCSHFKTHNVVRNYLNTRCQLKLLYFTPVLFEVVY